MYRLVPGANISLKDFFDTFFDDPTGSFLSDQIFLKSAFARGLIGKEALREPLMRDLFQELVSSDSALTETHLLTRLKSGTSNEVATAIAKCYHAGWMQKTLLVESGEEAYVFPSPIHRWNMQRLLLPPISSTCRFNDVIDLTIEVLKAFNPSRLNSRPPPPTPSLTPASTNPSPPGDVLLPEDHFGAEFYRCATSILPNGWIIAPQYGDKDKSGGGAIDLFLGGVCWGFEFMKQGDRTRKHLDRFLPGGAYHRWIRNGSMMQYVIIDFRTVKPSMIYPGKKVYLVYSPSQM